MNGWMKLLITVIVLCMMPLLASAQKWTVQDSLRLKELLNSDRELKINPEALKSIDFGGVSGTPRMSEKKNWLLPDETLPQALPKPKVVLTLRPYTARTPYNWDPVYQKKIRVNKNTWRGDPLYDLRRQRSYSNWAHNPMEGGVRNSLEAIEASGVQFRQLSERANGMMVNSVVMGSGIPLYGEGKTSGVTLNGGTLSGLDLMTVFTKDFWSRKSQDRRARTLEVLRSYGDSTTVLINKPIEQITR